jgi:3-dehydroquinate dehydratase II
VRVTRGVQPLLWQKRRGNILADRPVIFVLNGPNLNLLGTREPAIYGTDTLDDIAGRLDDQARLAGADIDFRQSNHEGHLIDWLHEAQASGAKAVLLNAGAYTHTSIAIHDAMKSIKVPVIEVHLSDPHKREAFRHLSYVGMAAVSCFAGYGAKSYELALDAALQL